MKKNFLIISALLAGVIFVMISCSKNSSSPACDGKGTFCFSNKRDTLLRINIVQLHITLELKHDEMQCQSMAGGATYTIKYSGPAYTGDLKDTTILVQNCDNKTITIYPPPKK
jgi:hypothetical protein